jgi:isopenicillin-N epimerase
MPSAHAHLWQLDPSITYLNHGSFGATPTSVLDVQQMYRARMEQDLVRWFVDEHHVQMDIARQRLASTLNCPWQDLALVPNATTAVATAFMSLVHAGVLREGDDVLVTSHEYPACKNNALHWAKIAGANVVEAKLPFPIASKQHALDAVVNACTPRTRVALISHVTSSSGLVLPIEQIVHALRAKGVRVIVDGAHAPGMLVPGVHGYAHGFKKGDELDAGIHLEKLAPAYYTANCHKWFCAPKGAAFLYVHPELQSITRPLALSNNANNPKPGRSQFLTEFDYLGTADYTPAYCIPAAIDMLSTIVPGGIAGAATVNRNLCLQARDHLLSLLAGCGAKSTPNAPDDMIACICTMSLPLAPAKWQTYTPHHDALHDRLYENHRVQVPVWSVPPQVEGGPPLRSFRIACQLYNTMEQYEKLGVALREELMRERSE